MSNNFVKRLHERLAQKDEELIAQRAMIADLRDVMQDVVWRYCDLYEQAGKGPAKNSVAVREMQRVLRMTADKDNPTYRTQREIIREVAADLNRAIS